MRSYIEILNELKETIELDNIPEDDEQKIDDALQQLFDLLWEYSY